MIRKILIVSATGAEIMGLLNDDAPVPITGVPFWVPNDAAADVYGLVTGVGSVATTFHLSNVLATNSYDLLLNIGLAGAFNRNCQLGDVVEVNRDCFSDLGVVDHDQFISVFELGLQSSNEFPYVDSELMPDNVKGLSTGLQLASAITVNSVHGDAVGIDAVRKKFPVDLESMEGAAFFYVAMMKGLTCLQIRAVSNYVEPRNRDAWEIKQALKNLWIEVKKIVENC